MEPYIKVQKGETIFSSGDGVQKDVTLGAALADTTKAFVIATVRGEGTSNVQNLDQIFCTAEIVNSTTIRFKRQNSTNGCVVAWQVVEASAFAPTQAFTVETGEVSFGSSDTNLTDAIANIGSVANAHVIVQVRADVDFDNMARLMVRGSLDDATTVRLRRTASGSAIVVRYWVVKWSSDFVVRTGSVSMTGNTASDTFSSVTTSRSLVFINYDADTDGIAQTSVKAHLASATQINFERETSTGTCNIEYAVVEFPSDCAGQSNNALSLGTNYSNTSTVTAVDLDYTILTGSSECTGTGTAHPRGIATYHLTDTTTVTVQRSYDGQTHTASWTLIDTSGWAFVTTPTWQIQRQVNGGAWTTIEEALEIEEVGGGYEYTDEDVSPGNTYNYRVKNVIDDSEYSNEDDVTLAGGSEPPPLSLKQGGVFGVATTKVKVGGTFQDVTPKIKVGGVF